MNKNTESSERKNARRVRRAAQGNDGPRGATSDHADDQVISPTEPVKVLFSNRPPGIDERPAVGNTKVAGVQNRFICGRERLALYAAMSRSAPLLSLCRTRASRFRKSASSSVRFL